MELNLYIRKLEHENTVMSGRMKTLLEYNEKAMEQKTDWDETQVALKDEDYQCICGGQMLE